MNDRFKNWQPPELEDGKPCKYGWVVKGIDNFTLGENTDIGYGTYIQAQEGIAIEKDVQIGGGCYIYSVDTISGKHGPVHIKAGARVGAGTIILPNVTIGEGATIGAGTRVLRDVPAGYTLWEEVTWNCIYPLRIGKGIGQRRWFWGEK